MKILLLSLFFLIGTNLFSQQKADFPDPVYPLPTPEQLEWHKMEMNAFIHFTTNTFTGKEWGFGDESPQVFNPEKADVEQWIKVLKHAGFKGIILTAKHHDGFCLWPSAYTEHSVKNSPYKYGKGDIVKQVAKSCKKNGLKFGIYLSPWDRNHADYGKPAYIEYYRNQLLELIEQYGPVFEIWLDGANGGDGYYGGARETRRIDGSTYYRWPETIEMVHRIDKRILFFSDSGPGVRWVGNEQGIAGETNWNSISTDSLYAGKPGIQELLNTGSENGTSWVPAETDVSIRPGWFYHDNENEKVKSPEQLFDIYLTSVGRGSTLLLNVPPNARGLIHEKDIRSLNGFQKILQKEFRKNLARRAIVKASNYRMNDKRFRAENLFDNNPESFWVTDDSIKTASIEIVLHKPSEIKYVLMQEYINLGQRIKSFSVEVFENNQWVLAAKGTTVGYKRILKLKSVTTDKLRIKILDSKACPVLSAVEIY